MADSRKETTTSASGSVSGKFSRLKEDSASTAAELREFVGNMRGKSAAEVLGEIAESQLASSIGIASVGIAVLLVLGTLGPYMFSSEQTTEKPAATSQNPGPTESAPNTPMATNDPAATGTSPATNSNVPSEVDAARAAAALGIDETKTSDPATNPLENNLDNLLDGVK